MRPYQKLSVTELRIQFEASNEDLNVLRLLEEELDRRRAPAAKDLLIEVIRRRNALVKTEVHTTERPLSAQAEVSPAQYDVFLSYAHTDRETAAWVHEVLTAYGLTVWIDVQNIRVADNFHHEIARAIRQSSYTLFLWSRSSASSAFVQRELAFSFELGKPIVPVRLESSPLPDAIEFLLAGRQYIAAEKFKTHKPQVEAQLVQLAERIRPREVVAGKTCAVLNMKGGVGKTTLAANIFGIANIKFGKSVLLIDLDPQYNLTQLFVTPSLHLQQSKQDLSVVSLFEASRASGAASSPTERLAAISVGDAGMDPLKLGLPLVNPQPSRKRFDLVCGQFELVKYALPHDRGSLQSAIDNFRRFVERAKSLYDYVVIDAAPGGSFVHECILRNVDFVVCPLKPDRYSKVGSDLVERLQREAFGIAQPIPMIYMFNNVQLDREGKATRTDERAWIDEWAQDVSRGPRTIRTVVPFSDTLRARATERRIAQPIDELAVKGPYLQAQVRARLESATSEVLELMDG